jgi:transposase-like protein
MTKRRKFLEEIRATVALGVFRGDRTAQEIAAKHKVHPKQVMTWKRQVIAHCPAVVACSEERGPDGCVL